MEEVVKLGAVKLLVVLGFIALSLSCQVDCGSIQGSRDNIGVVGQSLVVNWTYISDKSPTEVTIIVELLNSTRMSKMWAASFSGSNLIWTETDIKNGTPEAVFAKSTIIKNDGTKNFYLTLKSVPANVEDFRFACIVSEGAWSTPAKEYITIKLASQPVVNFKVRNSNGNSTTGSKLEMVCDATGLPPPVVKLEKQSSSKTVILKSATERVRFTIDNLEVSHNGKYVCIAKNIAGDVEKAVLVEVKYKPVVNFTVVADGDGDYVTIGKEVNMYCSASGFPAPKISIYTVQNSTLQEVTSSMNRIHYTISNIQPKDSKGYICSASNIAGTSDKKKHITVRYIQVGSSDQQDLIVNKGGSLQLVCDVTGVPSPAFSWEKDGKRLTDTSAILQVKFDNDASFGKYTCKASNTAGKRTVVFVVKEIYITKNIGKADHILKLGEKKTLHCTIDGHPIIKHTWYKGKKKLSESKTLEVHLDKKEKFGNYSCVGKNNAGEEVLLFSLKENPTGGEQGVSKSIKTAGSAITALACLLVVLLL